ncbi:MAG: LPS assembly protein LptD, partial [Gammaproteobacteria bacterium]|nr:LPS assembly protein LptD [Gammaproteobacteria bacterium]
PPTTPITATAEEVSGGNHIFTLFGNAKIIHGKTRVSSPQLTLNVADSQVVAPEATEILVNHDSIKGNKLDYQFNTRKGTLSDAQINLSRKGLVGQVREIQFVDKDHTLLFDITLSSCRDISPEKNMGWSLSAKKISIDTAENLLSVTGASLKLKGFPILPTSNLSLPATNERKSGFLTPTVGWNNKNGLEMIQPYYWNLAPNMDATTGLSIWGKRGYGLNGEWRYLTNNPPERRSTLEFSYVPNDLLWGANRWAYAQNHSGQFTLSSIPVHYQLSPIRVSDNGYWSDFSLQDHIHWNQRLIPSQYLSSFALNDALQFQMRWLNWQTIQLNNDRQVPPYNLWPQINGSYTTQWNQIALSLKGSYANFHLDPRSPCPTVNQQCQPNGERWLVVTEAHQKIPIYYSDLTPKIELQTKYYQFSEALISNHRSHASLTVPIFSVDWRTKLSKISDWGGVKWHHYLVPRLSLSYTPFYDQNFLPIYDTSRQDLNIQNIFATNPYNGYDRTLDGTKLVWGLSTQLVHPISGKESINISVAQSYIQSTRRINLPNESPSDQLNNTLLQSELQLTTQWRYINTMQYNTNTNVMQKSTQSLRYRPADYHVANFSYKKQRDINNEQFETSWQWPIAHGPDHSVWRNMGRLSFDILNRRISEGFIGLEYLTDCWASRFLLQHSQIDSNKAEAKLLLQLDLFGLIKIGSNPTKLLESKISGFTNYQPYGNRVGAN